MFNSKSHSYKQSKVRISGLCGVPGLLILCLIFACDSRPYVASVNDSKIYLEDYQLRLKQKMAMLPKDVLSQPDGIKQFEEEVLDGMITERLMQLRARELNISVSEAELEAKIKKVRKDYGEDFTNLFTREKIDYEQWKQEYKVEMLMQKLIAVDVNSKIKITEKEIEDFYNEHRNHYKTEARVKVAQIVVRDLAMAKKIEARLKAGEDFAKVAAAVSIGPEALRGGDLGFITRRIMPEPLDQIIFNLPVNQISPIVQSPYGFHIFKVLEKQQAKTQNLAQAREDIITDLRLQKEEAAFTVWLETLKKKAVIKKEARIPVQKVTGIKPKVSFGNISQQARGMMPSASRDKSTCKFQCILFLKLGSHELASFAALRFLNQSVTVST